MMRTFYAMFFATSDFRSISGYPGFVTILFIVLLNALPQFAIEQAYGQRDSDAGYIDSASITNKMRLRFDAGFDLNRPDRAEFFYGSWANLADHKHAIKDTNQLLTAVNDRGPFLLPEHVDYQDVSLYLELARTPRMSVFVEQNYRFSQFHGDLEDPNAFTTVAFREAYDASSENSSGLGDTQFGFKYAMWNCPDDVLTFQLRTFIPTGDSRRGLGTGNFSIEPGLLFNRRLTNDSTFMAQLKYWSPIDGGANAGNIAIYGAGLSRDFCACNLRVSPIVEFVGWTVLDGFETLASPQSLDVVPNTAQVIGDPSHINNQNPPGHEPAGPKPAPTTHGVQNVSGHTIINMKLGIRTHFSEQDSVYLGWGRALTGDRWYQDVFRFEFRRLF